MSTVKKLKSGRSKSHIVEGVKSLGMESISSDTGKIVSIKNLQKEIKGNVSSQFRSIRKELGVTQKELERRTGIAQPNITRFESESCNPTLEMMIKMAAAIDMKLNISFEPIKK